MGEEHAKARTAEEFAHATRAKYAADFDLFGRLYAHLEESIQPKRSIITLYERAQDMLFFQAFKGMQAAGMLLELALVEDAATIARRILEVAMRMMWLQARDKDKGVRDARVDDFLATLWHEWRPYSAQSLDPQERGAYEALYDRASKTWKDGKKPPRPTFKRLFEEAGASALYDNDYAFLSRIAHGTTPMLVRTYATSDIEVHDDTFVPAVLRAVTRNVVMCAIIWNATFDLTDGAFLNSLAGELLGSSSGAASHSGHDGPSGGR